MQANDVFTSAFKLLVSTVRDEFYLRGRPCLGATLKPRLNNQGFNESSIGFRKFGDFLRTAEASGYISLTKTVGGDIAISLARLVDTATGGSSNVVVPPAAVVQDSVLSTPTSLPPITVRQDLWNAFNSLSDKWVYDPQRDTAFKERNESWLPQRESANMISVPPGKERLPEWMRSFAAMQPTEIKASLMMAVDEGSDIYRFNLLTRVKGLQREWSRFHVQKILSAIETWATANKVYPRNIASPFRPMAMPIQTLAPASADGGRATPVPSATPELDIKAQNTPNPLNTRLENLIDGLIDELITLRGLLQVAGPKRA